MNHLNGHPRSEAEEKDEVERLLTFHLGSEQYAVPLLLVREVIGKAPTTPVPFTPPHFLGILNLRGKIISVIDLRVKFNLKAAQDSRQTAIIITELGSHLLGVVVDSIDDVLPLQHQDIKASPSIESRIGTDYIKGVVQRDKSLTLLLDITKALSVEDRAAIDRAQSHNAA